MLAASVSGFSTIHITRRTPDRYSNSQLRSDIMRDETSSDIMIGAASSSSSSSSKMEVWLDLRGTSITPKAALELWRAEVQDDMQLEDEVTAAPISIPFTKCLISSNAQYTSTPEVDVVIVDKNGVLFSPTSSHEQSTSIGQIVTLESSQNHMPTLPDPLPLIDKYSNGEWILLDTNAWKKINGDKKLAALFPVAELIISMEPSGSGGKIGWTCHTKNEITKSSMWIKSHEKKGSSGMMSAKILESGIMIPREKNTNTPNSNSTDFIIVIPYDSGLLRTASSFILEDGDVF